MYVRIDNVFLKADMVNTNVVLCVLFQALLLVWASEHWLIWPRRVCEVKKKMVR